MTELNTTAHKILDAAQSHIQTAGYNAFSYKDLQQDVGVKTSTMHYYFPTKQDLAAALLTRHNDQLMQKLREAETSISSGLERINFLGEVFIDLASEEKFCVYGMLTSDLLSMSEEGKNALGDFFSLTEEWLVNAINLGKDKGEIHQSVNSVEAAAHYLATLEGGVLIARAKEDKNYMRRIVNQASCYFNYQG